MEALEAIIPIGDFVVGVASCRETRGNTVPLLTLGAHARGLQYSFCLCVCLSVCVFSLFWHLAQSGVQTAVSATSARYGHEI